MTEGDDLSELRKQANTIHSWTATSLAVGKRLYAFSRRQREPPGTVDVNELVGECLDLCRYRCQRQQILLIADLHPEPAKVEVRPGLVQQAIINLILNAREALHRAGEEGSIRVGTEVVGAKVQVVVEDDGPGVEAGQAEAIFEAGVTVKGEGDAGWGLTVARHIARRHGGDLRRIPADGGHFVLELPTAA
jgi:signal transduction histidine kinase